MDDCEVRRPLEARRELAAFGRCVLQDKADAEDGRVEVDSVAEDQEHDHRQHEGNQVAAGIAEDLKGFLPAQGPPVDGMKLGVS